MKIAKKLLSISTAILCAASAFTGIQPLNVNAEEGAYGDLAYYTVDENKDGTFDYVEITDCDASAVSVEIPSEIDGLPVTTIGDYAFCACHLTEITISNSVTTIGKGVFRNCDFLTEITIPDSVTTIGDKAFENCQVLTKVTIPDSVTTIGDYAFYSCEGLTEITIPNSVTYIGRCAFACGKGLTKITIENPVCEIFDYIYFGISCFDYGDTISYTATIYGYENSTAQKYAEKYDRKFELLGEVIDSPDGDSNGDGILNVRDAAFIAQKLAKGLAAELPLSSDYNDDGKINVRDAAAIAKFLATGKK